MDRREWIRAFGAGASLALMPREALAAWARVAAGFRPSPGLTEAQLALVSAVADTLLPRTDTPGAVDVGVAQFVNVVVAENYDDDERAAFAAGLDAIDARAMSASGAAYAALDLAGREATLTRLETETDRRAEPMRTYWRLKSLVVHGYFTSQPVMQEVLRVNAWPGAFDGDAPMPAHTTPPHNA